MESRMGPRKQLTERAIVLGPPMGSQIQFQTSKLFNKC